jgi:hypothetical protein
MTSSCHLQYLLNCQSLSVFYYMLGISSTPGFLTLLKMPMLYFSIMCVQCGLLLVIHDILLIISLSLGLMEYCYTTFLYPQSVKPICRAKKKGLPGHSNMTDQVIV